jgi:hypothetical protein
MFELVISALFGAFLSVVIIKNYSANSGEVKTSEVLLDTTVEKKISKNALLNEEKILLKSKKIKSLLGMTEEEMRDAIRSTNAKIEQSNNNFDNNTNTDFDNVSFLIKFADYFFLIFIIAVLSYGLNETTQGEFGRFLLALFPKEFEALKLSKYLKKFI